MRCDMTGLRRAIDAFVGRQLRPLHDKMDAQHASLHQRHDDLSAAFLSLANRVRTIDRAHGDQLAQILEILRFPEARPPEPEPTRTVVAEVDNDGPPPPPAPVAAPVAHGFPSPAPSCGNPPIPGAE